MSWEQAARHVLPPVPAGEGCFNQLALPREHWLVFWGAKGQDFSSDSTFLFYLLLVSLRTWPDKVLSEQSISAGATTKTWLG